MSSSDEWDDSDTDEVVARGPVLPRKSIQDIEIPYIVRKDRDVIPTGCKLVNVPEVRGRKYIFRCEPADKKYPGIVIPENMRASEAVLMSIYVHNSVSDPVPMRLPNLKTKNVQTLRRSWGGNVKHSCIFLASPASVADGTVYFKKKCHDKATGKQTAFDLGKDYLSHTRGFDAQFTIMLIPYEKGRLVLSKASRTEVFHIESKRPERQHPRRNKRLKRNTEVDKINTNIHEAEIALKTLRQELGRLQHHNKKYEVKSRTMKRRLLGLPDGPVKKGIAFALRNYDAGTTEEISL